MAAVSVKMSILLDLNSKRLSKFRKRKESRCLVFTSSTKREIWHFHHPHSRAVTTKKCTKKRNARAKLLFEKTSVKKRVNY